MATNSLFYDLAHCLLLAVKNRLIDERGPIDRSYVAAGAVAADCDQLTVQVIRVFGGFPGNEGPQTQTPCAAPRTVELSFKLYRCVPTMSEKGAPPSPAELEASAAGLLADLWVMIQGIRVAIADGFGCTSCKGARFGTITPLGPQGGLGGWDVRLEAMPETMPAGS